jgi:hypothetical protein
VLNLAASPVPGEAVLPLLLPRFLQRWPRARLRERIGEQRYVVELLARREVELAVVGGPFRDPRFSAEFLARDELALVARRDHPLAGRGPLRLAEVGLEPLVLRSEESGARAAVETALTLAGLDPAQIRIAAELGSTEAVKRAVEAGLGLAFVSLCTLAASGPAGELRLLPLADEPPARDLLVLTEPGRPLSPLAVAFRELLLAPDTRREVGGYTRLPARLRPAAAGQQPGTRASPAAGLEQDPLMPPANPIYRLARLPATPRESLVARLLAETYRGGRAGLLERLADELRRAEGDPLARAPDIGLYRHELYREEAASLLDHLLGDLLVEVGPES